MSSIPISSTSLSLFPGLVFNPNGTLNSAANPAPKGATLVMYGTGIGSLNPVVADGAIMTGPTFPLSATPFSATVLNGGAKYAATIPYLGVLPEFVAGAVQANIQIPGTVPAGASSLVLAPLSRNGVAFTQTIYMFSDPPVLTGLSPASPIPQSVGLGNYLTLTGQGLTGITTVTSFNFSLNGQPVNIQPQIFQACTATSCTVAANFAGMSGQFGVTVTNPAGQVSNALTFTVQPYGPPTVGAVTNILGTGPVTALNGSQIVNVDGTNFVQPVTASLYYQGAMIATLSSASPLQTLLFDGPNCFAPAIRLPGEGRTIRRWSDRKQWYLRNV